jgi:hypothetical protein
VDAVCCVGSPDRLVRSLEHEGFNVDGGHLGAEALRDRDGRGPHAASDVEHAALPGDRRTLQQLLCRDAAAGMDDAFPDDRHEDVRIEPLDLGGFDAAALQDGHAPRCSLSN